MAGPVLGAVSVVIGGALAASFGGAVNAATKKVREIGQTVSDLNKKQAGAEAFANMRREAANLRKEMKAARDRVAELQAAAASGTGGATAAADLRKATKEAERLEAKYRALRSQTLETGAALRKSGVDTSKLAQEQKRLAEETARAAREQERQNRALALGEKRQAAMGSALKSAAALGATVLATRSLVTAGADFETAMLGVAKQVEGARDSGGKLTTVYHDMYREIQRLGREIPIPTAKIAEMVAAGARMGVARDDLLGFTRTSAMMADAFGMDAAELADSMGKIAGLFKIPIKNISGLADAVNYLDDNAISKGGDIIDFLTRTGGVAASVKVTGQEMAALGSTLLTLGERAETASTATNALFQKMAAASSGTKKAQEALETLGLAPKAVQKGMQQNAIGTLLTIMDRVGKLKAEDRVGVLTDLVGLEHSDTLAKLAANTGEFRRQLEMANGEAAKGSMSREFAARLQTTNAQMEIWNNRINEVAVNLGSALLPAVNSVMSALNPLIEGMGNLARENPRVTAAVVGTALALGTLATAIAAVKVAVFTAQMFALGSTIGTVVAWVPKIIGAMRVLTIFMMTNPIGLILVAIGSALAAIVYYWDDIKKAAEPVIKWLSESLKDLGAIFDRIEQKIGSLTDNKLFNGIGAAWNAMNGMEPTAQQAGGSPAPATGSPVPPPPPTVRPQAQAVDQKLQVQVTVNNSQAGNPQTVGQLAGAAVSGALKDFGRSGALYDTPNP